MRNCMILGCGRSGTSMVAGCLRHAGYYMGRHMLQTTATDPEGFYESRDINDLNETILRTVMPERSRRWWRWFGEQLRHDQLWLSRLPVRKQPSCPPGVAERIRAETSRAPFCFKDPRFSYTLPVWRPFLEDVVYVCVFREPGRTANSMLRACREEWYLGDLPMTTARALQIWSLMYRHILEKHARNGAWVFLHFDQVLRKEGLDMLERHLGVAVDRTFPKAALKRSSPDVPLPRNVRALYRRLCERAGYAERGSA